MGLGSSGAVLALGRSLIFYPGMPRTRVPSIPEKPTVRTKKPEPSRTDPQARPVQPNLWDFFTPGPAVGEPIEETTASSETRVALALPEESGGLDMAVGILVLTARRPSANLATEWLRQVGPFRAPLHVALSTAS